MSAPRKTHRLAPDGFDVVCTIGRVEFGDGPYTPYETALLMIGQHGATGEFTFPAENGDTVVVNIEHRDL
jgi:hypothetical protein